MQTITVFVDGKPYAGRFAVEGNQITLESAHGNATTSATGVSAMMIAAQLLHDRVAFGPDRQQAGEYRAKVALAA